MDEEKEKEIFVLFSGKTFIVCGFFDLILSIEKSYIFVDRISSYIYKSF